MQNAEDLTKVSVINYYKKNAITRESLKTIQSKDPDVSLIFTKYANAHKYQLPDPKISEGRGIWSIISDRQSIRNFQDLPLQLNTLEQLIWSFQGYSPVQRSPMDPLFKFRTAPSSHQLYPFETFIIALNVEDLPVGIYHYSSLDNTLEEVKQLTGERTEVKKNISSIFFQQSFIGDSACIFVLVAILDRIVPLSGIRTPHLLAIEAGTYLGQLGLGVASLSLGGCIIGGYFDDELSQLLNLDLGEERIISTMCIGLPKKEKIVF